MSAATRSVGALENGDGVAGLVQLRGGAESSRAGADHGHLFAGALSGRHGGDPAFVPAAVNDGALDAFDGDGRGVDAEHARAFARRGADAAGEFGEIVRLVQPFERLLPQAAIDEVVPFRDEVVDGTAAGHAAEERAGVAEGRAAVHAARALLAQAGLRQVQVKFLPVRNAPGRRTVRRQFAQILNESCGFAHAC